MGRNMDAIVVDNEKTAKDCIQYIKEQVGVWREGGREGVHREDGGWRDGEREEDGDRERGKMEIGRREGREGGGR
jgi:hypothetical protein